MEHKTITPTERGVITRRIKRRARMWRDQYRVHDGNRAEVFEKYRSMSENLLMFHGATRESLHARINEGVAETHASLWRTRRYGRRECQHSPRMADYWRGQTMNTVFTLRQAQIAHEAIDAAADAREAKRANAKPGEYVA